MRTGAQCIVPDQCGCELTINSSRFLLAGGEQMIKYTERLDKAIRVATYAHRNQVRKGSKLPYIVHPYGVMIIASSVTDDEDILIACLFHDILEDVPKDYPETRMQKEFGKRVVAIVKDVTKDDSLTDWHKRSKAYLNHLENEASDEAVIVSASDKINNIMSMITDYEKVGDDLWKIFSTKSSADQLWWYESILQVILKRNVPVELSNMLSEKVATLKTIVTKV